MKPGNAGGGKGPQLKGNARSNEDGGIDVSLTTPESVQKLQTALHDKAKESPDFRFYCAVRQGVPERCLGIRL